jgi:hypothetical protein
MARPGPALPPWMFNTEMMRGRWIVDPDVDAVQTQGGHSAVEQELQAGDARGRPAGAFGRQKWGGQLAANPSASGTVRSMMSTLPNAAASAVNAALSLIDAPSPGQSNRMRSTGPR